MPQPSRDPSGMEILLFPSPLHPLMVDPANDIETICCLKLLGHHTHPLSSLNPQASSQRMASLCKLPRGEPRIFRAEAREVFCPPTCRACVKSMFCLSSRQLHPESTSNSRPTRDAGRINFGKHGAAA